MIKDGLGLWFIDVCAEYHVDERWISCSWEPTFHCNLHTESSCGIGNIHEWAIFHKLKLETNAFHFFITLVYPARETEENEKTSCK